MTFKELIDRNLNTGGLTNVFSVIFAIYYVPQDRDISYIDVITRYTSVVRGLVELTPDNKIKDEYKLRLRYSNTGDEAVESVAVSLYNKEEETDYAVDLIPWREMLHMSVLDDIGLDIHSILAHILWEITFYGFTSSDVDQSAREMRSLSERIKSGEEKLYEFDIDELDEDIGFQPLEGTAPSLE